MGFEQDYESSCRVKHWGRTVHAFSTGVDIKTLGTLIQKSLCASVRDLGKINGLVSIIEVAVLLKDHLQQIESASLLQIAIEGASEAEIRIQFETQAKLVLENNAESPFALRVYEEAVTELSHYSVSRPGRNFDDIVLQVVSNAFDFIARAHLESAVVMSQVKLGDPPDVAESRLDNALSKASINHIARSVLSGKPIRALPKPRISAEQILGQSLIGPINLEDLDEVLHG